MSIGVIHATDRAVQSTPMPTWAFLIAAIVVTLITLAALALYRWLMRRGREPRGFEVVEGRKDPPTR